jgi:hypothetical protein
MLLGLATQTAETDRRARVECHSKGRRSGNARDYSNRESHFLSLAAPRRTGPGFDSVSDDYRLDWWFSLPPRRVLLASSVDAERLDRGNEGGKETRVIRFRKKALLEDNVSEMRTAGWEPRWESYRETQTGLLVRRIVYSVVMERKQRKRRGLKQLSKLLFPTK